MKIYIKSGKRFGKLTVKKEIKEFISSCGEKKRRFICLCDCGKTKKIFLKNLRTGGAKSCGCSNLSFKHGLCSHPLYRVYAGMKTRCSNPQEPNYKYYGGRGIKVEWESFEDFYRDMENGYKKGLSIDRINVNKDYSKKNCRWVTHKTQMQNTRSNVVYKGEMATYASRRLGGAGALVTKRLKRGWSLKQAFTIPVKKYV